MTQPSFPPKFRNTLDLEKRVAKLERKVEALRIAKDEWKHKAKTRKRKLRKAKARTAARTTYAVGYEMPEGDDDETI